MDFHDIAQLASHRHAAAIRTGYAKRLRGGREVDGLEELVRAMAREARESGVPAERAIVMLKASLNGDLPVDAPHLATAEDQRRYGVFEAMLRIVLDEYFGELGREGRGRLAS